MPQAPPQTEVAKRPVTGYRPAVHRSARDVRSAAPAAAGSMQLECKLNHIIKIASRSNLNCSYCYVYNQADTTWRNRPAVMSRETFDATISR